MNVGVDIRGDVDVHHSGVVDIIANVGSETILFARRSSAAMFRGLQSLTRMLYVQNTALSYHLFHLAVILLTFGALLYFLTMKAAADVIPSTVFLGLATFAAAVAERAAAAGPIAAPAFPAVDEHEEPLPVLVAKAAWNGNHVAIEDMLRGLTSAEIHEILTYKDRDNARWPNDTHNVDNWGTPLHNAAVSCSPRCLEALLGSLQIASRSSVAVDANYGARVTGAGVRLFTQEGNSDNTTPIEMLLCCTVVGEAMEMARAWSGNNYRFPTISSEHVRLSSAGQYDYGAIKIDHLFQSIARVPLTGNNNRYTAIRNRARPNLVSRDSME